MTHIVCLLVGFMGGSLFVTFVPTKAERDEKKDVID